MTRQEAIERIQDHIDVHKYREPEAVRILEALDMAIEALKMAEIKVPIQINLPEDWIEQIVDRLRNDPDAEWAEIIRCKDCKHWEGERRGYFYYFEQCSLHECTASSDDFCSWAERREE